MEAAAIRAASGRGTHRLDHPGRGGGFEFRNPCSAVHVDDGDRRAVQDAGAGLELDPVTGTGHLDHFIIPATEEGAAKWCTEYIVELALHAFGILVHVIEAAEAARLEQIGRAHV